MKFPALASLILLCPALVLAQQEVERANNTAPAPGNQQLDRVSVTRQQTDTDLRRREPVAKQLYGREELDKYGDTQLSDVLKRLPGINVSGGQLRMRGLGGPTPRSSSTASRRPRDSAWTTSTPPRSSGWR